MAEPARWQRQVEEFVLVQIGDPPSRVLEIGCGKGELARTLARARHSVTAIDPRAPEGRIFRRVRIEEFNDPGPFDHVVACLSLHHVEDLGMALDKVTNLLRAGGALVVIEFAWDRFDKATAERMGHEAPPGRLFLVGGPLMAAALLSRMGAWKWRSPGSRGDLLRRVGE